MPYRSWQRRRWHIAQAICGERFGQAEKGVRKTRMTRHPAETDADALGLDMAELSITSGIEIVV